MPTTKKADADDPNVKVFTLGDHGVNLTTSPLHVEPGELSSAQNAVFSLIRAKHGISKRPGMTKMNASAAAGAVLAFQSIPIADPSLAQALNDDVANGLYLYAFADYGTTPNTQTESADASTWVQPAGHLCGTTGADIWAHLLHKGYTLLAPKSQAGAHPFGGVFEVFDGTTWADAFTLPDVTIAGDTYSPNLFYSSDQDLTNFYISAEYYKTTGGAGPAYVEFVWQVNQTTYTATRLGEGFIGYLVSAWGGCIEESYIRGVAVFDSKVWIAGSTYVTGTGRWAAKVWWIAVGGSAWTLDMTYGGTDADHSVNYHYGRICGHGRQLWCGWRAFGSGTGRAVFRKRDGEVWSTIAEGPTNGADYYEPVYAIGDEMYAFKTVNGTNILRCYHTVDAGATMTLVFSANTPYQALGRAFRWAVDDELYCAIGNGSTTFDIVRLDGGDTTSVFSNAGTAHIDAGLFGAAKAPTVTPTTPYTPDPGSPADPVLPTAPSSVMAKCAAYRSTTQAIAALKDLPISFEATVFNVGTMYASATPARLTVPYGGAGYYLLTGQVAWDNAAGTRGFWAKITVKGSVVARSYAEGNVTSEYVFCRASALVKLADGDQIQLLARQVGPGAWNAIGGVSETFLHAIRLV